MKIKKNGKIISLTESDLKRIVKGTLNEESEGTNEKMDLLDFIKNNKGIRIEGGTIDDTLRGDGSVSVALILDTTIGNVYIGADGQVIIIK